MAQLIVARFNDQFAATAAVSKLLANGVRREQMAVQVHARFADTPQNTASPTHPIPGERAYKNDSHRGRTTDNAISPRFGVEPEQFGHSVVTVAVGNEVNAEQLRQLFETERASSVESRDGELPESSGSEHRDTTEAGHSATEVDRQRALDASRGGRALDASLAGGGTDPLVGVEKSPAQNADDHQVEPDDAS